MLKHPTLDGLQVLKLTGMVAALTDQMATPDIDELAFEERLGLLVGREGLVAVLAGGLEHGVRRFDLGHEALGFNQSNRFVHGWSKAKD